VQDLPAIDVRTGQGIDVHAFGGPGPVVLGGVQIAHDRGLAGHSDADCVMHAVADALLGAAALGDIGMLFPDTDPAYAGADSSQLLADVASRVRECGWSVTAVDVTVVAQTPRVAPHREAMVDNIATACGIEMSRVNVKATTTELLGFLGRSEGIAAFALATVVSLSAG